MLLAICVVAYIELTREETKGVGEGLDDPKPQEGPRIGCTDPYATNWYPQADYFGLEPSSLAEAVEGQVCTYPYLNQYNSAGAPVVLGKDLANQNQFNESFNYALANVCYQTAGDNVVVRHLTGNQNAKQIHPLTSCHEGEIFLGVIDKEHILLDEREGQFPETEYSTGNFVGSGQSILKPQDGQAFKREFYFEHVKTDTNPGFGAAMDQIRDTWYTGDNGRNTASFQPLTPAEFFNVKVLKERGEAAASGNLSTYRDNMYGKLFLVGDPRYGNLIDFDFDKNAMIGTAVGGLAFENAIGQLKQMTWEMYQGPGGLAYTEDQENYGVQFQTSPTGELSYPTPEGTENVVLNQLDLDHDGFVSFYELMLMHGAADRQSIDLSTPAPRLWNLDDVGPLGYDGIACSETENPYDGDVACFPFSEDTTNLLLSSRMNFANGGEWMHLNSESAFGDAINGFSDFMECFNFEVEQYERTFELEMEAMGLTPGEIEDYIGPLKVEYCIQKASFNTGVDVDFIRATGFGNIPFRMNDYDVTIEVPEGLPMAGAEIVPKYIEVSGPNRTLATRRYAAPDVTTSILEDTAVEGAFTDMQYPYDFKGDQRLARQACPASHPNFVRFCQQAFTSDHRIGEAIDIDLTEYT